MIGGKVAVVCGYGDVGKGCAAVAARPGRPRHRHRDRPDLRAAGRDGGLPGHHASRTSLDTADIFVTATGNKDIITAEHMARMKHKAIVGNIGHFDNEIDMAGLAKMSDVQRVNIKPQVDECVFPDGHSVIMLAEGRLLNLGCATGHPSFVMSNSFTNQVHRPDRAVQRTRDFYERQGVHAAQAPRREGGPPAPRHARREAHQAHRGPGRLPRHPARTARTSPTTTGTDARRRAPTEAGDTMEDLSGKVAVVTGRGQRHRPRPGATASPPRA